VSTEGGNSSHNLEHPNLQPTSYGTPGEDEDEDEEEDDDPSPVQKPLMRRVSNQVLGAEVTPAMDFVFGDFDVNVAETSYQRKTKPTAPIVTASDNDADSNFVFGDFIVETELENQIVHNHLKAKLKGAKLKSYEERALLFGDFHLDSNEMNFFDEERSKLKASRPRHIISSYTMHTMIGHANRVKSIALCPNERAYISCSSTDREAAMIDLQTGTRLLGLNGHSSTITNVVISANSKLIATCGADCNLIVWDFVTGKKLAVFLHGKVPICAVFNANCKSLISGAQDKLCRVWDMRKKKLQRQYSEHAGMIIAVTSHPTQDLVASASSDKTVHIWNTVTGLRMHVLEHTAIVLSCKYSTDGTRLLCNDEGVIRVWNTVNMTCVLQISTKDVTAVTRVNSSMRRATFMTSGFCPGEGSLGHYVLASCSDRSVRVFQGTTGKEVLMFYCKAPVYCLDAGQNSTLVFGDSFGNIYAVGVNKTP
jgi:WD40 repeat protein